MLPPELRDDVRFAWRAWCELSGDRPVQTRVSTSKDGWSAVTRTGPIPFASIDAYARREGLAGEMFDLLVMLLRKAEAADAANRND